MSFMNKHISVVQPYQSDRLQSPAQISIPPQYWPQFQELIQRGSNLWPDASPEIKEFADRVTVGRVQQDYYSQANVPSPVPTLQLKDIVMNQDRQQAINLPNPPMAGIPNAPDWHFQDAIAAFNEMYKMPSNKYDSPEQMLVRLQQFKKIILDEVKELDLITAKLATVVAAADGEKPQYGRMEIFTELADLLGDIQVFCASEMKRFDIPLDATLRIIMDSNSSKLQADGTALFVDGKLQKGPNYWKPEPMIEEMLRHYYDQV